MVTTIKINVIQSTSAIFVSFQIAYPKRKRFGLEAAFLRRWNPPNSFGIPPQRRGDGKTSRAPALPGTSTGGQTGRLEVLGMSALCQSRAELLNAVNDLQRRSPRRSGGGCCCHRTRRVSNSLVWYLWLRVSGDPPRKLCVKHDVLTF